MGFVKGKKANAEGKLHHIWYAIFPKCTTAKTKFPFPSSLLLSSFQTASPFLPLLQISLQHVFGLDSVYLVRAWYSPEILCYLLLFPKSKILYFLQLLSSVLFKIQFKIFFFPKYFQKFPWTRAVSFLFSNNFQRVYTILIIKNLKCQTDDSIVKRFLSEELGSIHDAHMADSLL